MSRAYSFMQVKALDEDKRLIRGIATTPTPDRADDIVEPTGAKFALPIPFLWQHMHSQPIGMVTEAAITDKGIEVVIQLTKSADVESETLKKRLDEAWDSIKTGLVRGLSIGFRALKYEEIPRSWGLLFTEWEWYELSAVTIAANSEATITEIKSVAESNERKGRAAPGTPLHEPKETVPPAGDSAEHKSVKLFDPNQGGVKLS